MADLSFGVALDALKAGKRVARIGWNGKGMFLFRVDGGDFGGYGIDLPAAPYIAMKTAQNNVVPWLASQADILSDDWLLVETPNV